MKKLIPVEGNPGLARCAESGAIVNINKKNMAEARRAKEIRRNAEDRINSLEEKVDQMMNILKKMESHG